MGWGLKNDYISEIKMGSEEKQEFIITFNLKDRKIRGNQLVLKISNKYTPRGNYDIEIINPYNCYISSLYDNFRILDLINLSDKDEKGEDLFERISN